MVAPDLKGFGDSDKPFLARQYRDEVLIHLESMNFEFHDKLYYILLLWTKGVAWSIHNIFSICPRAGAGGGAKRICGCVAGPKNERNRKVNFSFQNIRISNANN